MRRSHYPNFCNRCGIPLGDDEKFPLDSTVYCYDCSLESIQERRKGTFVVARQSHSG